VFEGEFQFYDIAARMMRRILVDHARSYARLKRGGQAGKISLDEIATVPDERAAALIGLNQATTHVAAASRATLCSGRDWFKRAVSYNPAEHRAGVRQIRIRH